MTRNCNALGTWQQFDPAECGTLSNQLREIGSYLEVYNYYKLTPSCSIISTYIKKSLSLIILGRVNAITREYHHGDTKPRPVY